MYLTVKDVAARINITYRRAIRLIRSKRLTAVDIGEENRPSYRVTEEDLAAFLAACSTKKAVAPDGRRPSKYFK